ncbi:MULTISPECIES: peptidoglycan DD-metalloendopeptidase family protein [Arthrobacter]|uniref:Peptidoglycan DD-metalloendopeptidase family protein n=2 Tax=Arthrobacter TaxID=1663 RepID=A0ABU9KJJ3_9MICC|nr:peptidoglycan DD-metalloendopeptidase family protein [Arthrobacter sp. YJM1]MDP5227267.1 peptidoglycan DD-metalloendopeptidase family protein [Arthrobacter sp. YJM1]
MVRRAASVSAVVALLLAAGIAPSRADDLDDQQQQLQNRAADVQSSLEFLDGKIAKSAADLTLFQGQLPGAQKALSDAQGRVASATAEAAALAARVDAAQQSKARLGRQIEQDQAQSEDTRKLIGQIATQAYKSGGVPDDLSLLFGSTDQESLVSSISLADQALRTQNAAMEKLNQQKAVHVNQSARLAAVEQEISDLKAQADAALAREQVARDEAARKKAAVDTLVADTTRLNKELTASKPAIQAQLAKVNAQQNEVAAQIKARDERLRQEWLAEQQRKAEEAARNSGGGGGGYVPPAPGPISAFGIRGPFDGNPPITSGWGWRATPPGTIDFWGTGGYMHTGIDFGVGCGTPVHAAAAGTVVVGGWLNNGGGYTVQISHGVVQGNALTTVYYHNSSVVVSPGQQVAQGQVVAYSGSTGNSTGCHAHFETWVNGSPVDPMGLL